MMVPVLILIFTIAIISNIQNQLKREFGPIPGLLSPNRSNYIFESFFVPRLQIITKTLVPSREKANIDIETCRSNTPCCAALIKGVQFCNTMKKMYPWTITISQYLEERPDFHLGRFLSLFADKLFRLTDHYIVR